MSADYQMVILFTVACSITLHDVIFGDIRGSRVVMTLGLNALLLILFCDRVVDLTQGQTFVIVFTYGCVAGIYGGTYDGLLRPYVKGRVLRYAYCMHVGLWTGFVAWATRWWF